MIVDDFAVGVNCDRKSMSAHNQVLEIYFARYVAIVLTLLPCVVGCEGQEKVRHSLTPGGVYIRTKLIGSKAAVKELWDTGDWNIVVNNLQEGGEQWLQLVPTIASGSDAGPAEDIGESLGLALIKNPAGVLRIVDKSDGPIFGITRVCSIDKWDNIDKNRKLEVASNIIGRLGAVRDPNLEGLRNKCIQMLRIYKGVGVSP